MASFHTFYALLLNKMDANVHVYDVYTNYLLLHAMSAILTCAHVTLPAGFGSNFLQINTIELSSPSTRKLVMLEVARLPRGFLEILGFFAIFRVVHFLLNNFAPLPFSLASAPPRKIWIYRNISVSFIHACVAAFLSVYR